jgi:hypothetical protein
MRETPAKHEVKIFVGGVAPTKISVRWGRPREIQRPCRALGVLSQGKSSCPIDALRSASSNKGNGGGIAVVTDPVARIGKQKGRLWEEIWTGSGALDILPMQCLGKLHELSKDHGAALQWGSCRNSFACVISTTTSKHRKIESRM